MRHASARGRSVARSPARRPQYTRALKATKLERMFAKPFVAALEGHTDGVYRMAPSRHSLVAFLTGSCDGEVRLWDLAHQACVKRVYAHSGFVRGLAVSHDGRHFFTAGDDKYIKQFPMFLTLDGAVADDPGLAAASAMGAGEHDDSDDGDDAAGSRPRSGGARRGAAGGAAAEAAAGEGQEEPVTTWMGKSQFMCASARRMRVASLSCLTRPSAARAGT